MKVGNAEGSPQEINDAIEISGSKLEDYLEKPEEPLRSRWLAIPCGLLLVSVIILVLWADGFSAKAWLLVFLTGFAGTCGLAVSVQIRFKNSGATCVAWLGALLLLLLAASLLTPIETLEAIRKLKGE